MDGEIATHIFNADRSRFNTGGHNWQQNPVDTGAPISEDCNLIESAEANPVVADLDRDGKAEAIFASWTQQGSNCWGKVHILSFGGQPIDELDLPAPKSSSIHWNGSLAAPTLANVDGDPDLELIANTASSGVVVYDLPGMAGARVLWGTGRGSTCHGMGQSKLAAERFDTPVDPYAV